MHSPSPNTRRYDVIVIGAGPNGLTAAALLAKHGRRVVVLERRKNVGGLAVGGEFHPGYISAGLLHDSSAIHPLALDELNLKRLGLQLRPGPPAVLAPQPAPASDHGGRDPTTARHGLLLYHDPSKAAPEIGVFSLRDADRYAAYRAFFSRIAKFSRRLLYEPATVTPIDGLGSLTRLAARGLALRRLGRKDLLELLRLAPMSLTDWLGEWFETDLLKCLLAAPALQGTFLGPRSPGSATNLLRYEAAAGRAALKGPRAFIAALEAAAVRNGVEIRVQSAVERIRISGGAVEGVTLRGGECIDAPIVAASCDPKRTFLQLVAGWAITPRFQHRIEKFRSRGTTAKINLALSAPLRFACRPAWTVEFARIAETLDHMEQAFDAVKYGRVSETPILDVYVPSVSDPDCAPKGHAVVSILAHYVPLELANGWTEERREQLGDAVVHVLGRYAPELGASIVAREVLTPRDIERRYGTTGGQIHHGEHALDQLFIRPSLECARYATPIDGLYLCGSGCHPGGGLTAAPGTLAASAIVNDAGRGRVSRTGSVDQTVTSAKTRL